VKKSTFGRFAQAGRLKTFEAKSDLPIFSHIPMRAARSGFSRTHHITGPETCLFCPGAPRPE